jgi:putative membrane protein
MVSSFYTRSDAFACREVPAARDRLAGTGAPRLHQMGTGGRCVPPIKPKESPIMNKPLFALILGLALAAGPAMQADAAAPAPNDAQIAHIAYTAGAIDVTAAKQALALVKKLGVTPEDNATSQSLASAAAAEQAKLAALSGDAYDKAYAANEVAFHQTVNGALSGTLIPAAQNAELKSLLETGLKLFQSHQMHAEHLAQSLK